MSKDETKTKILNILNKIGRSHIKKIAEEADLSPNTTSKYLSILEETNKVDCIKQPPYKNYNITKEGKKYVRKKEKE